MANFNFGFVGNIVEVAKHADANIDTGPVGFSDFNFVDQDFTNFVANSDAIHTIYGSPNEFIWGQKWGNSTTRVTE